MASAKQIKQQKAFAKKYAKKGKKKTGAKSNKVQKAQRFSISSSERKQTKNLDVYSPPPESYKIGTGTTQAKKGAKEKRKMYGSLYCYYLF